MKLNNGTASIVVGIIIAVGLVAQSIAGDTANADRVKILRSEFIAHCVLDRESDIDTAVKMTEMQKDIALLLKIYELQNPRLYERANEEVNGDTLDTE